MKNTKFIVALVEAIALIGVLLLLVFRGALTEGIFIAWLGAFVAVFAVFSAANVVASGQAAGKPPTP